MANLRLTFACGPFDRTQALRHGIIRPEGIDLVYPSLQPAENFWRMLQFKEFHSKLRGVGEGLLPAHQEYLHEQGPASRRLAVEELFAASTLRDVALSEGQLV
jgi:4,5-dihydroxyphthalate decarboxylase